MDRIPKAGESITTEDFDMILEAIGKRHQNFPNEPPVLSMAIVMMNIGDRFAPVACVEGEWKGHKKDLYGGVDVPKCPNGHAVIQGVGLKIGWIGPLEKEIHNVPAASNSDKTHIMDKDCWCYPKVEEDGTLIIHQDERKLEEN